MRIQFLKAILLSAGLLASSASSFEEEGQEVEAFDNGLESNFQDYYNDDSTTQEYIDDSAFGKDDEEEVSASFDDAAQELAEEYEDSEFDEQRIDQAAAISVQEFQSSKAKEIDQPAAAFQELQRKGAAQSFEEDENDEEFDEQEEQQDYDEQEEEEVQQEFNDQEATVSQDDQEFHDQDAALAQDDREFNDQEATVSQDDQEFNDQETTVSQDDQEFNDQDATVSQDDQEFNDVSQKDQEFDQEATVSQDDQEFENAPQEATLEEFQDDDDLEFEQSAEKGQEFDDEDDDDDLFEVEDQNAEDDSEESSEKSEDSAATATTTTAAAASTPTSVAAVVSKVVSDGNSTANPLEGIKVNAYTTGGAIVLIVIGAFMIFFGQRAFKVILFMFGFLVFGTIGYGVLNYLTTHNMVTLTKNTNVIYAATIAGSGLIGGGLFVCCFNIASHLFGAALGLLVSVFFVKLPFVAALSQPAQIGIMVGWVVLGVIFGHFVRKPLLIVLTAFVGSFAIFVGVDFFVKTGFATLAFHLRTGQAIAWGMKLYLMCGGFFLVAVVGAIVQFQLDRKDQQVKYQPAPTKQV